VAKLSSSIVDRLRKRFPVYWVLVGIFYFAPDATFSECIRVSDLKLEQVPIFLQRAVLESEDKNFYSHSGVDYLAIAKATFQNLSNLKVVRGASTISEQLVKLKHKLPRTLSGRVRAAYLARELEKELSKEQIFAEYLSLIPFQADACGVDQGAMLLFKRSLSTLTEKEMLALAVLIRAPSAFDPLKRSSALERRVAWLLNSISAITPEERARIASQSLSAVPRVEGIRNLRAGPRSSQSVYSKLLSKKVIELRDRNVEDGAIYGIDNQTGEAIISETFSLRSSEIDSINTKRQPGSALKPFLYALAFERGHRAEDLIQDAPLFVPVGNGVHSFRNYSGEFYGAIPLKEALGSSLNTPAVRLLQEVGEREFWTKLRELGFSGLEQGSDHYGEGLALGNAAVTLKELVNAYRVLAAAGRLGERRIFSEYSTRLVTQILIDPDARRHEFGVGGLLQFPIETAVKTGTSNDHHDAWAIGFSKRFTIGVWFGNLNRTPMKRISGSKGPAWVLRGAFDFIERAGDSESFDLETAEPSLSPLSAEDHLRIVYPTSGLMLRFDPRIPDELESMTFQLGRRAEVVWIVDGERVGESSDGKFVWNLQPGDHTVAARLKKGEGPSEAISFTVR